MNKRLIAKVLNEERKKMSGVIQTGLLRGRLGNAGFNEAVDLRWIFPNVETGEMALTRDMGKLTQIRELAEADAEYKVGDPVVIADNGKPVNGVVKEIRRDGRVVVSFDREANVQNGKVDFSPTELARPEGQTAQPGQASPTAPAVGARKIPDPAYTGAAR